MILTLGLIIGVPLATALLVLALPPRWAARASLLPPAIVLLLAVPLWTQLQPESATVVPVEWFPSLGISANLRLDRLGLFFVLLIGGIGLGIVQYARYYLGEKTAPAFWAALLAFMGAMLGIVLSDSLILLFVFWELTTITSALLIGMDFGLAEARHGAIQAFLVTGLGGLALLAGIVLLGQQAGSYDLSVLATRADSIVADPLHIIPLGLMLVGAFTKSAQFPFHFWLPGAMAAPAPVSSYLHSATMVKAGVFLLGRLFPVFSSSPYWLPVLATVGLTTFVVAGWHAVRAYDLKQLLAYSTVAYLGVLTALYGYYARVGMQGELLNIMNHALYKSSLFLLIGWLEKAAGTRDLSLLEREKWVQRAPLGGLLFGIGAFAMAGLPFVLGFVSKETLYHAISGGKVQGLTLPLAITIAGSLMATTYALKLWVGTFWGSVPPPESRGYPAHKISPWLLIVPAVLLLPQFVLGVSPRWFLGTVLEPGTTWGPVAFWRYLDVKLMLSLGIIVGGSVGFLFWRRFAALPLLPGLQRLSQRLADFTLGFSTWLSRVAQAGGHARYIAFTLLFTSAALAAGLLWGRWEPLTGPWQLGPERALTSLPALLIGGGGILAVLVSGRIPKVIMAAIVGYGMAIIYVLYRAPDLALTQLLVETFSLILLLLVFRRMPRLQADERPLSRRAVHAIVACAVGLTMGGLALIAGSATAANTAGSEQLQLSLPLAKGRNVVNVILVDFRGVDTFGEITVLAIAALGALALFRVGGVRPELARSARPRSAVRRPVEKQS